MTATMTAKASESRNDFIAISASMLVPSRLCGVSLYICDLDDDQFHLFRAPNIPITPEWIAKLEAAGHRKLYISSMEHQEFQRYLRANLKDVLGDEHQNVKQRFASLNAVVRDVLAEALEQADLDTAIAKVEELSHYVVELICRTDAIAAELCSVLYKDYHTFTHSANVAYFCVMISHELGISSKDELCRLAMGAMLHDLGKREIPDAILTKPGKLTPEEFRVVKAHPTTGFRRLSRRPDLSFGQLMMVYQHHERLDGTGYPVRIGGGEIHPWARICAVADVFEALTSNRPYRPGMSREAAFEVMDRQAGMRLDAEFYERWKKLIQKH